MKKLVMILIVMIIEIVTCTSIAFAQITIDLSSTENGLVKVMTDEEIKEKIKVVITNGEQKVTYDLLQEKELVPFALTFGSGKYLVCVYENTTGKSYKLISNKSFNVKFDNDNLVYLNSTNEVKWNKNDKAIEFARNLTKDAKTDEEKVELIYKHISENYKYDFAKPEKLDYTYKPDINEMFDTKTGICYDYSAIFAGMLRSLDVPTKLVKGYNVDNMETYHAWNEVLVNGEWKVIDTTNDAYLIENGIKTDMYKEAKDYIVTNRY